MFKLNSIFKIVIVMFLSLVIPSFLSIFKISFDEYVSAQKSDVQGESVVRVQTVNNRNNRGNQDDQSVLVDFVFPKTGTILNLSQRPFKFPKPQQIPVSSPTNTSNYPVSYLPVVPIYDLSEDAGRGNQSFLLTYGGVQGDRIVFYNGNEYDLNDVRIEIKWMDGSNEFTSVYSTFKIQKKLYYYENKSLTAEATIPYNPAKPIKSIKVTFKDNVGASFSAKL